ncbi:MAG: sugar phosphate isomerase/epimerase family protein [bacterium]
MNRIALAALTLASAACVASVHTKTPPANTLTIGFATADFKTAKAAGFEFAEVRIREFMKLSDADFATYAADCRTIGLPLTTAYWLFPADMKVVGPSVQTDQVKGYLLKALDRSQQLGVKVVVWGSGDSRRAPDGFSHEDAFNQLVVLGKFLAPEAQRRGMVVVAEPLRKQEGNTINSSAEGLRWVEAVNHPNFQLLLDVFHMREEGEDMSFIVKAGPHIAHMHMSNPVGRVLPLNSEEFDYRPFFAALSQIGYRGTMTIETAAVDIPRDGARSIAFVRSAYAAAANSVGR